MNTKYHNDTQLGSFSLDSNYSSFLVRTLACNIRDRFPINETPEKFDKEIKEIVRDLHALQGKIDSLVRDVNDSIRERNAQNGEL